MTICQTISYLALRAYVFFPHWISVYNSSICHWDLRGVSCCWGCRWSCIAWWGQCPSPAASSPDQYFLGVVSMTTESLVLMVQLPPVLLQAPDREWPINNTGKGDELSILAQEKVIINKPMYVSVMRMSFWEMSLLNPFECMLVLNRICKPIHNLIHWSNIDPYLHDWSAKTHILM